MPVPRGHVMLDTSVASSDEAAEPARHVRLTAPILHHPVLTVAAVALAARVGLAVVSFVVNETHLVDDELQYLALGSAVANGHSAESWFPGYGQSLYDSVWIFISPLVVLFKLFGHSRLVAQLSVVGWGAGVAAITTHLAGMLVARRWAIGAGVLVAILPSQVLWSSVVLRESMVWFFLAAIALLFVNVSRTGGWPSLLGVGAMGACIAALLLLRDQTAVAAAWSCVLAGFLVPGPARLVRGMALAAVCAVLPALFGLGPLGTDLIRDASGNLSQARAYLSFEAKTGTEHPQLFLDEHGAAVPCPDRPPPAATTGSTAPGASALASGRSETRTSGGKQVEVICGPDEQLVVVDDSASAGLRHLPTGMAVALLRPYPWETDASAFAQLASVEGVVWYCLYVLAAIGVVAERRRLQVIALPVLLIGAIVATSAMTQGNVGTAFRHRAEVLWALAVFAAVGASWLRGRVHQR